MSTSQLLYIVFVLGAAANSSTNLSALKAPYFFHLQDSNKNELRVRRLYSDLSAQKDPSADSPKPIVLQMYKTAKQNCIKSPFFTDTAGDVIIQTSNL
jgi:hypothetical protein